MAGKPRQPEEVGTAKQAPGPESWDLYLYIAGETPRAIAALSATVISMCGNARASTMR